MRVALFRQPGDYRLGHRGKWAAYSVSYTGKRRSDGAEIFPLKKPRHAGYWTAQAFPVLLVIRNSEGEVRWLEVSDWLKCETKNGKKTVKRIVFVGERFDVMSVLLARPAASAIPLRLLGGGGRRRWERRSEEAPQHRRFLRPRA